MLSFEDNEMMCRVGPGTPMGELLRRYWHPALLSREIPEPDSPPVRVKLLGEELVAFRDTDGNVGLIDNYCPHRRASMFFGRNEECGLRCVYHGWKFDVNGDCVDMPSEPAESNFKDKVKIAAYPTIVSGGLVWTYMGPAEHQPAFPEFGFHGLPEEHYVATKTPVYCNYIQSIEGNIDSAHISFLHRSLSDFTPIEDDTDRPGYPSNEMARYMHAYDRAPTLAVQETSYGFRLAGLRKTPAGNVNVRINNYAMPLLTFTSNLPWERRSTLMIVPSDDENCWRFGITFSVEKPLAPSLREGRKNSTGRVDENGLRLMNATNDYLIDRAAQRDLSYSGIGGVGEQDYAVTESMGAISDRENEHLGTTDAAIITLRRLLIKAARDMQEGQPPPWQGADVPFNAIRSEEAIMSPTDEWRLLGASAGEDEGITGTLTVKPVYEPDSMGGEFAIERRVEKPTYK